MRVIEGGSESVDVQQRGCIILRNTTVSLHEPSTPENKTSPIVLSAIFSGRESHASKRSGGGGAFLGSSPSPFPYKYSWAGVESASALVVREVERGFINNFTVRVCS